MIDRIESGWVAARKLCVAAVVVLIGLPAFGQDVFTEVVPNNANLVTGPEVGERIPAFSALDQHGVRKSFEDIVGPNGAMVIFFRSADW